MTWDPQAQIEELAKNKLNSRLGLKKELRTLPGHLHEDEEVLNLSSGMYDGANGLIVLTDRRIIFLSAGALKSRFEDFPYSKVSSVQHSAGMMFGELIIFASGNKAELKQMAKDRTKEIAEYIRNRIADSAPSAPAPLAPPAAPTGPAASDEIFEKLKKLGELRDGGVITPEDFESKKQELLSQL